MKKLIKLDFNNTTRERKTEDSYSELYSHDKNNGSFEFEILNDTLTTEQVIALFKFTESNKIWKTTGTVEGNKVNVTFDTTLITQNETVICYLYFDEEQRTSDTFRFKFKVKVSEIDKMSRYEVKERFINNTVIVDRLDVVTKDELKEALKNVGGIATEGLLTEVKAEELYAKKSEAVDNTNFELVKNRVLALELKTDKDTVYDDSELKGRISVLEAKEDNNTIYDDTNVRERLTALESKPNVDVNNFVTKDELASKNYLTEHQDTSNFALKSEIPQQYNDTEVKERLTTLENKAPVDLSGYATKEELHNISGSQPTVDNLVTKEELEAKHYISDVSNLATKEELQEVRNSQPTVDTSHLVTRDELTAKNFLTEHQSLDNLVTKQELEEKHFLTTHQDLSEYAKKSELYNDTPLKERVTALESKAIEGGAYDDSNLRNRVVALEGREDKDTKYDDTDLRNRITNLENKPPLDTSEFVTNQALESRGYIKDTSNFVTKDELASKNYLTEHQPLTEVNNRLNVLEARPIVTPYNDTALSDRVTALETKQDKDTIYNDEPIKERLTALETRVDKDTIYNDTELRERVTNLENKPNVDLSNYVTNEQLENKHYLTEHQQITHLATTSDLEALRNIAVSKSELSKKLDATEYNTFKDIVVTKDELAGKGYLTEHQDISNLATKQEVEDTYAKKTDLPTPYNDSALVQKIGQLEARVDKDTVYNDAELKRRVTALEEKPNVDTSNFVTTAILESKGYLTSHQDTSNFALKSELPQPYNDSALVSRINVLEAKTDNDTVYNDTEVKQRLTALESRPSSQSEMRGTGMPNGVVEAPIGATYIDTAKTNGALKWIKTTDGGNTGWKVVEGDTGWVLSWQENIGKNKNRMYFRRKNDVVHVKFNPEINSEDIKPSTNLILQIAGYFTDGTLSIDGFKPVDDVVQTIFNTSNDIYSTTTSAENSEGSQGTGAVIIQYEYNLHNKSGLKLQIVTSELGVEENHVNPFSYLTEDEWPVQLP